MGGPLSKLFKDFSSMQYFGYKGNRKVKDKIKSWVDLVEKKKLITLLPGSLRCHIKFLVDHVSMVSGVLPNVSTISSLPRLVTYGLMVRHYGNCLLMASNPGLV